MKVSNLVIKVFMIIIFLQSFLTANESKPLDQEYEPQVFLDCKRCYFDYLRDKIRFVNYVREREEAEIYILLSSQQTGSGGVKFILDFIGQNRFQGKNDTLSFYVGKNVAEDVIRKKMQKYMKMGLVPYIYNSNIADQIEIKYYKNGDKEKVIADRWNNWVFSIEVSAHLDKEESNQDFDNYIELSADRITKAWKIETEFDYHYSREVYTTEDEEITAIRDNYDLDLLLVKSLGKHYSLGAFSRIGANKYSNLHLFSQIMPAIEYNIFPYSEANLRQLCLRYHIGYRYNNYIEQTIYNKNIDHLPRQSLALDLKYKRRWGDIDTYIEASNYFPDIDKNRFTLYSNLSLYLFKGFSLNIGGHASLIHDQISLPRENVTKEERLLQIRELKTNYSYYFRIGFEYTFGSIYNNIVNPRF